MADDVAEDVPVESTEQVSRPGAFPLFQSEEDVEFLIETNAEHYTVMFPAIRFKALDRAASLKRMHPVYREVKVKIFAGEPGSTLSVVEVPCRVIKQPQRNLLKKYGLENHEGLLAFFSNRVNERKGIDPNTGDLLEFEGIEFEIMTSKQEDFILNTQVPLNKLCTLQQHNRR